MFPYIDSDLNVGLEEANHHISIKTGFLMDSQNVEPEKRKNRWHMTAFDIEIQ